MRVNVIAELSLGVSGTQDTRPRNFRGQHTISFNIPSNEQHHIASEAVHSLKNLICHWFGVVSNCYILHDLTMDNHFSMFDLEIQLERIHYINERITSIGDVSQTDAPTLSAMEICTVKN